MITLVAQKRDIKEDLENLRKSGSIPAVYYGKKTASTPITLSLKDFTSVWKKAGESSVVVLNTPSGDVETLIHDVDIDPVSDVPRHADFYVFEKGKKVEVSVPIEFDGISPAIKDLGGSLIKALHELKISSDPQSIPHVIKVNISSLVDFESKILAKEIPLPSGVELIELMEEVVAAVAKPKGEEVEEVAPVDLSTIEVEKKGKKDEEEVPTSE